MNRIGEFHKVSIKRYIKDVYGDLGDDPIAWKLAEDEYGNIKMPVRATTGSAGYDIYAPVSFSAAPGGSIKIPTGLKVEMEDGWVLAIFPRSSMGFKHFMGLANTVGIIDSDYICSDNEGHIWIKVVNNGSKDLVVEAGQAFAQGIFLPFGITYSDNADGVRNGGMGSTDTVK